MTSNRRRRAFALVFSCFLMAVGVVGGVLYHWWNWYEFTDFASLGELEQWSVGVYPVDIDEVSGTNKLYVLDVPKSNPADGSVQIVDTSSGKVVGAIELASGYPNQLAVSADGKRAAVAVSRFIGGSTKWNDGTNRVDLIDAAVDKVVRSVPLPGRTATGVALSRDGSRVYVTDRLGNRLFVVDFDQGSVVSTIPVSGGPWQLALDEDEGLAYVVACRGDPSIAVVVDLRKEEVIKVIPLGLRRGTWDGYVRFAPNGRYRYVTHARDSKISVVDCDQESSEYHQQVALIETPGKTLKQLDFNAAGSLAVVASCDSNQLLVVDTRPTSPHFNKVVDVYPTGGQPSVVVVQDQGETGRGTTVYAILYDGTVRVYRPLGR